jgi:hypothetical protein
MIQRLFVYGSLCPGILPTKEEESFMGKKTENKNSKSPKSPDKIRLLEETAYKNIQTKKGDDRTAIWIKNKHLAYVNGQLSIITNCA